MNKLTILIITLTLTIILPVSATTLTPTSAGFYGCGVYAGHIAMNAFDGSTTSEAVGDNSGCIFWVTFSESVQITEFNVYSYPSGQNNRSYAIFPTRELSLESPFNTSRSVEMWQGYGWRYNNHIPTDMGYNQTWWINDNSANWMGALEFSLSGTEYSVIPPTCNFDITNSTGNAPFLEVISDQSEYWNYGVYEIIDNDDNIITTWDDDEPGDIYYQMIYTLGNLTINLEGLNDAGTCNYSMSVTSGYNGTVPFPTITPNVNVTPTLMATLPGLTPNLVNRTWYRDQLNGSILGNFSLVGDVMNMTDETGEAVNTTVQAISFVITSPLLYILNILTMLNNYIVLTWGVLVDYTVVPLQITGSIVNILPWQIKSIISFGLVLDIIILILKEAG